MKMKMAPTPNIISIVAYAKTPKTLAGATASSSQPAPETANANSNNLANYQAQTNAALGKPKRVNGEQDLHDRGRLTAHLPSTNARGHRHQKLIAPYEIQTLAHR